MRHTRGQRVYGVDALVTHWEGKETQPQSETSLLRILLVLRDEDSGPLGSMGADSKDVQILGLWGLLDKATQYLQSLATSLEVFKPSLDVAYFRQGSCVSSCHTALFRE